MSECKFVRGDCLDVMRTMETDSVDLVFCSPPYEAQRSYGELGFNLKGEEWVTWAVQRFEECLRVCKGLVAWVVEGSTDDFAYSSTPFLLMADLHRKGYKMRKPAVYGRAGIPGSGGPEWLRNDWEPIICATKAGKIPWSNPKACGHEPKYAIGGNPSHRYQDGSRISGRKFSQPDKANPGNIIRGSVGGSHMGWKDATRNEAPFPEWLAEFFVRSFCPLGGLVLDPFSGSGTTVAMAVRHQRRGIGIDARQSQIELGETRLMGLSVAERDAGQMVLF